jgi:hypothetical protein
LGHFALESDNMNQHSAGRSGRIRGVVSVATVLAMVFGIVSPALASAGDTATFSGAVMAPDGTVAEGFTVQFKDVATGQEFRSGPTGAEGQYEVSVPTGGKYRLEAALAPDGTKLAVANVPPVPVMVAGMNRLDVQFTRGTRAATPATPTSDDKNKKKKGGVPWWKEPGPITGLVVGSVVFAGLIYLAVDGDSYGNNNNASPSYP